MVKRMILGIALLFVVAVFSGVLSAADKPWFDMENCAFCKNLLKDPGLLENMTWEHYDIHNGALVLTIIDAGYKDSYNKAEQAMKDVAMKMAKGETEGIKTCGHCDAYAMLMMSGVNFETIETNSGSITLMTGDDEETVKKIQAFAQRNRDEYAKMQETEPAED